MADLMELWLNKARFDFEVINEFCLRACESPIEKLLLMGFLCETGWEWAPGYMSDDKIVASDPEGELGVLRAQVDIGDYRADFVYTAYGPGNEVKIVVECDGHEFHEKTKKQAARDKKRDRDLTRAGYLVMHFTGSEIFADPVKCSREVRMMAIERAVARTRR